MLKLARLADQASSDGFDGLLLADGSHARDRASVSASTLDAVRTQRASVLVIIVHIAATLVAWWDAVHGRVLGLVALSVVTIGTIRRTSTSIIANDIVQVACR